MVRSHRKPTAQRVLLFVGIVLFVLGLAITVGLPPVEALPDPPELGNIDTERLPDRSDLPTEEELRALSDTVVRGVNTVLIARS
jgi:hypothetical protein